MARACKRDGAPASAFSAPFGLEHLAGLFLYFLLPQADLYWMHPARLGDPIDRLSFPDRFQAYLRFELRAVDLRVLVSLIVR